MGWGCDRRHEEPLARLPPTSRAACKGHRNETSGCGCGSVSTAPCTGPEMHIPGLRWAQQMQRGYNVCNKRGRARSQLSGRGRGHEAEEQHGERDCVLWPVRVEVSVQGFHVNVQGWEWGSPQTLEGKRLGLPMGSVSVPGGVQGQELGAPHHGPSSPRLPPPSVDGGYAGHLASCLAAPQHGGGHHRFTRGILRGRGKVHSQEPRGRLKQKEKSKAKGTQG